MSFFAFTKYKDKVPAELYKLEGIGDILFGIMLFVTGYVFIHVSAGTGTALIIAVLVLYVIFLVYLYSKVKKQ